MTIYKVSFGWQWENMKRSAVNDNDMEMTVAARDVEEAIRKVRKSETSGKNWIPFYDPKTEQEDINRKIYCVDIVVGSVTKHAELDLI